MTNRDFAIVCERYQITIPPKLRRKHDILIGDVVKITIEKVITT